MTLGVIEAARRLGARVDVPLAMDSDPDAAAVYQDNFARARVLVGPVENVINGGLGCEA